MPYAEKKKVVYIPVTPEMHEALRQLAERRKRPLTWEARLALEEHLRRAAAEDKP